MNTKFKKNCLSLAISSILLLSVTNSNSAENAKISVDSVVKPGVIAPTTRLVSINNAGTASGNADSFDTDLSANGRFVMFQSYANDLVANDPNGTYDLFVRDLKTGTTNLVNINSSGTAIDNGSPFAVGQALSADGRFVAFDTVTDDLFVNDTNGASDIFVRDLKNGTTTLASVNSAGTASGNWHSWGQVLSANGRFLAFESHASDLVVNDTNGAFDVFVRDLKIGTTTLVSVNSTGTASGNFESFGPVFSADGRFVAFNSSASDLVANDTNNNSDIFVRDRKTETTRLVSINSNGTASGNGFSAGQALSANGRFVAFRSSASDLVANDTNGTYDIFIRDLQTGTTRLVSINNSGTASGNVPSSPHLFTTPPPPAISADGRFVMFNSYADDLVANDTNDTWDVFLRDIKTGVTSLVSINSSGTASGNELSVEPVLSPDGRFVAFVSFANDLVANDTNGTGDVFLRDLKTGTTRLVSVNSSGTASGNSNGISPVLSADGRFVAFHNAASDLVANDTNNASDVFVQPTGK